MIDDKAVYRGKAQAVISLALIWYLKASGA
jgi:hypothetical protein